MGKDRKEEAAELQEKLVAFHRTMQRSTELAQDLLSTNQQMTVKITSLESDLESSRDRISFLEKETASLRARMAAPPPENTEQLQEFEALLEEQNCMVNLFVTSERFLDVTSPQDAIDASIEVLHNLVGAKTYGIFVQTREGEVPRLLAPTAEREREQALRHLPLVQTCLSTREVQRSTGVDAEQAPVCFPMRLGTRVTGAILIAELFPQQPTLLRLQRDLLSFLEQRLGAALCLGALTAAVKDQQSLWEEVAARLGAR